MLLAEQMQGRGTPHPELIVHSLPCPEGQTIGTHPEPVPVPMPVPVPVPVPPVPEPWPQSSRQRGPTVYPHCRHWSEVSVHGCVTSQSGAPSTEDDAQRAGERQPPKGAVGLVTQQTSPFGQPCGLLQIST